MFILFYRFVEIINLAGSAPKTLCPTRWNSQFDCISELLKHKEHLFQLCNELELVKLQNHEIDFLSEFRTCMQSIAVCLDILQGEQNIYMGDLIPSIMAIDHKLQHLEESMAI